MDGFSLIIFLALCVWVGIAASNRGRNGVLWFFISFLISPLLGGLILVLSKNLKNEEKIESVKMDNKQLKDRVVYNEKINEYRLTRAENDINSLSNEKIVGKLDNESLLKLDNNTKQCPFCSEVIKKAAIKCRYCGSMLNDESHREAKIIECPFCKEDILDIDQVCKHCNSVLENTFSG